MRKEALPVDLRQLRYAIAAADYRSMRRAAEALRLKESTLSRCVRDLEAGLDVVLFERSRAGVRPTVAGAAFIAGARRVVQEVEGTISMAKAAARGEAGRLRIGFYNSLSAGSLRATLLDYAQRYPTVEIRTVEAARERLLGDLDIDALDVAIVTGNPTLAESHALALWSERILVALPTDHPLASREVVSWRDLRGETFLIGEHDPGPDVHDLLIANLATPGDRPRVVKHNISHANIKALVGLGHGVTLVSDACLGAHYAGVVYREARDSKGGCRIGFAAHWSKDNDNPALTPFLRLLRERYPALRDPD
jgi:DNA-binding transcriptional LysR family regulator